MNAVYGPIELPLGACPHCMGKGTLPGRNASSAQKLGPPNCWHCNGTGRDNR